ncbi:MAG: HD domain-containing protein [Clostridia bacterium]|nr:HD domain-containing protein [Clostridia bacterium]
MKKEKKEAGFKPRTYLQYVLDVFVSDGITYDAISDAYGRESITDESIRVAHTRRGRGNLPRGVTPEEFCDLVFDNFYSDLDYQKQFASQLYHELVANGVMPSEYAEHIHKIDGMSDSFESKTFHTFLLYLLSVDRRAKYTGRRNVKKEGGGNVTTRPISAPKNEGSAEELSARFFHQGAASLIRTEREEMEVALGQISTVFESISTLHTDAPLDPYPEKGKLLSSIRDEIVRRVLCTDQREILKIEGPLGCYKNRIMQYLCLSLDKSGEPILPFYIDLAAYEKFSDGDGDTAEKELLEDFTADIQKATVLAARQPRKTPVLLLDGVRDFFCSRESLYYAIHDLIQNSPFRLITCVDTEFTVNVQQLYQPHPIVSDQYGMYLRIRSMNLLRREACMEFIGNCIGVFGVKLPRKISTEQLYESLLRLDFLTVDAYWLVRILSENFYDLLDSEIDIANLYDSICLKFLGSHELVDSAAELAFAFEFGRLDPSVNPYFDRRWELIRKHRSVLDYLLAKHYVKLLSEPDLQNGDHGKNVESLSFFNMVLQKNVTRFVVAMLRGVDDLEHRIMLLASRYYNDLSLFGKSELTFWMARLQNPVRKKKSVGLLKKYLQKELNQYQNHLYENPQEKREAAFLIRGIAVSLIYENDGNALRYYLDSLLRDKTANSVNRGFHLEYYGDKYYIPNKTLPDFEDDTSKGEVTMTVLCLSLDGRMRSASAPAMVAYLEIMTLCNLIQARIEHRTDVAPSMDVTPFAGKCLKYLGWILRGRMPAGLRRTAVYFRWMEHELKDFLGLFEKEERIVHYPSSVMNLFSMAPKVERAGWVDLGIERPENIVEHMYNCWLMGLLYLPGESDAAGYDKNTVLKLLLIHDLGETVTGDISRPKKKKNPAFYDSQERAAMQSLFLTGTYPSAVNLDEYLTLWDSWDEKDGINAAIARDIDNLQTVFRFCQYYKADPGRYTDEQIGYWMDGIGTLETQVVKGIADTVVLQNPEFEEVVTRYRSLRD